LTHQSILQVVVDVALNLVYQDSRMLCVFSALIARVSHRREDDCDGENRAQALIADRTVQDVFQRQEQPVTVAGELDEVVRHLERGILPINHRLDESFIMKLNDSEQAPAEAVINQVAHVPNFPINLLQSDKLFVDRVFCPFLLELLQFISEQDEGELVAVLSHDVVELSVHQVELFLN
jgi:hypothetical protein